MNTAIPSFVLFASITWALALAIGCCAGLWLLWRRRGLRKWIADFDRVLEREERLQALTRSRA